MALCHFVLAPGESERLSKLSLALASKPLEVGNHGANKLLAPRVQMSSLPSFAHPIREYNWSTSSIAKTDGLGQSLIAERFTPRRLRRGNSSAMAYNQTQLSTDVPICLPATLGTRHKKDAFL
jgi:hypothetical protein